MVQSDGRLRKQQAVLYDYLPLYISGHTLWICLIEQNGKNNYLKRVLTIWKEDILHLSNYYERLTIVHLSVTTINKLIKIKNYFLDIPVLDPVFQDVRSRNNQMVTLRCTVLRANPPRLTDVRWFRNGDFIRMPMPDLKETPELKFKLEPTNNGSYECRVSNSAGTSTCTFNVSGEWNEQFNILASGERFFPLAPSLQFKFCLCQLFIIQNVAGV